MLCYHRCKFFFCFYLGSSCYRGLLLLALLFSNTGWSGWVSPTQYSPRQRFTTAAQQLDYLLVEINGTRRLLAAGTQIDIVRGDKLKIIDAVLRQRTQAAQYVNVVGFKNHADDGRDRGHVIDTARQLLPYFSQHGAGRVYAIVVGSSDKIHGEVFYRLLDPQLRYALLRVNDKRTLVLRDGEAVRVALDDQLTISNISVNFSDQRGLTFAIYRRTSSAAQHEIRFARDDKIFARIPLQITAD